MSQHGKMIRLLAATETALRLAKEAGQFDERQFRAEALTEFADEIREFLDNFTMRLPGDGWRPIETAPKDGSHIVGRTSNTYRWKKYKSGAPAWAIAAGGRWQKANEHGGWDNCDPDFIEWRPSPPVKEGE